MYLFIGDADMAPYELTQESLSAWKKLTDHFSRAAWLNPMDERYWTMSDTVPALQQVFSMFPLSPIGIEKAIKRMNRHLSFHKYL